MNKEKKPLPQNTMFVYIILITAVFISLMTVGKTKNQAITFPQFMSAVKSNQIETVEFEGDVITGKFKSTTIDNKVISGIVFETYGATKSDVYLQILENNKVVPIYKPESGNSMLLTMLLSFGPVILLVWFFMRMQKKGGNGLMSFNTLNRLTKKDQHQVTFADIAGIDDIKQEVSEIVDFLKKPEAYKAMGAKIPKGVLLSGEPGTGKTMLAKAMANEAGVPFFSASGSDFVEMFVGTGASRVRSLFSEAKKSAPCIIFIDELDAVAKKRSEAGSMTGGHSEQEQTLMQILTEMQGFEENPGIIVIGATNRPDSLDPAILRPGRFDRKIYVNLPDLKGREAILKSHVGTKKMSSDVNFEILAKATAGMAGANLENLLNESALMATRRGDKEISMKIIEEARDKILMGLERKTLVMKDSDKRKTAIHEAGHALITLALPNLDRLHKVSIIPRGMALGVTQTTPEENQVSFDNDKAKSYICMLMAGRAAEDVEFNHFSSGASDDLKRATSIARRMICEWGMSEKLGPVSFNQSNNGFENNLVSQEKMKEIDEEIQTLLQDCYNRTKNLLIKNKESLDIISEMLISKETCTGEEIIEAIKDKLVRET